MAYRIISKVFFIFTCCFASVKMVHVALFAVSNTLFAHSQIIYRKSRGTLETLAFVVAFQTICLTIHTSFILKCKSNSTFGAYFRIRKTLNAVII